MRKITKTKELDALYAQPVEASVIKVARQLTPLYRAWIEGARFGDVPGLSLWSVRSWPRCPRANWAGPSMTPITKTTPSLACGKGDGRFTWSPA